ncbi:MAG: 1-deoxy-D-xylulose-5-phosphate synthase [Lachnospiraceae bacterium]|nr:1-deoxy-D-xylulose-5-phosphate synthase [Lachnospiraceae bacterium]
MGRLLNEINKANDIKAIPKKEWDNLAAEIRDFLVDKVSKTGGHLSSGLGVVELTMALHLYLDLPKDKLIWDVGHQAYTHKLLTGRKKDFDTLRQFEGMSGFPKRRESECDSFDTGHSSTSISVANGMCRARELSGGDEKIVCVIGDGAMSGGMAYEALNNIADLKSNLIVVLNDNKMSISKNVGGLANYLSKIRTNTHYTGFKNGMEKFFGKIPGGIRLINGLKRFKDSVKSLFVPGMFFEDIGLTYVGPIDGHDVSSMLRALKYAGRMKKAVLLHVITEKGRGYKFSEENPSKYHGIGPFNKENGEALGEKKLTYTDCFSEELIRLAENNDKIVAITAAMPDGTGLSAFEKVYPDRFFDVGIAEEHAVTFAAGMAVSGYKPVVAIYSTFLQRAYDQIIHDVCLNSLPVVFAIDRAGIVGNDGETHQGIFDLSYLCHIPNMVVMAPRDGAELGKMMEFAMKLNKPSAIRYPKASLPASFKSSYDEISLGKSEVLSVGKRVCMLTIGNTLEVASKVTKLLEKDNINPGIINLRFASPLDEQAIIEAANSYELVISIEENVSTGGIGERISKLYVENVYNYGKAFKFMPYSLKDSFIEQGSQDKLRDVNGLNPFDIYNDIKRELGI